ncbi:uncharacterized protein [Apostichopus japonicus]|uniref:uncharacterized protein n=1 Tax=Stichopus japonicus TaxID=307972 RepID=UPI003AB32F21
MAATPHAENELSPKFCCMHVVTNTKQSLTPFKIKSWSKFIECQSRWQNLDCFEGEIARRTTQQFGLSLTQTEPNVIPGSGYHRECYQKFCNVRRLQTAESKRRKLQTDEDADIESDCGNEGDSSVLLQASSSGSKVLRSSFKTPQHDKQRKDVLSNVCLICQKDAYLKTITGARSKVKLTTCERKEAHILLEAARLHGDHRILLQIEHKDLVAIEVRYHNKCYRNFTRGVIEMKSTAEKESKFEPSFKVFAESIVTARLIKGQEILRLKTLNVLFRQIVKNTQALDASHFTTQRLKVQLRTRFHNLVFVKPSKRFESEIVYAKDINVDNIVERVAEQFQTPISECSTTTSDESDARTTDATADDYTRLRTLYHASQIIKSILQNTTSAPRWPPTADDLTIDAARNIVPVPLFSFLTWCVGFSDEAELTDQVCISEDNNQRILSLAQDLLYTSKKGCILLPKHSSLAMTIRHMTGSARLIGMLNRFGHCVSHSMVLEHDTALAESQLKRGDDALPDGEQDCFTTLGNHIR